MKKVSTYKIKTDKTILELEKSKVISKTVNNYIKNENWEKGKIYLQSLLKKTHSNDYWVIMTLAIFYYELRNYKTAFRLAQKAIKLNSKDYLVLDYYSAILRMIPGKEHDAINILSKIINTDINTIAFGRYGEGLNYAKSIVNDCRVKLALVYESINREKEALELYEQHLINRRRGLFSNHKKNFVLKKINYLNELFG